MSPADRWVIVLRSDPGARTIGGVGHQV